VFEEDSRTMILLDPGLDLTPSRRTSAPERSSRVPTARTLAQFLRAAQAAVRIAGHVTVLLTTDRRIRQLNRDFRGKDKATDVLSFPADPGPEKLAGDLAVSVPTARKQASACGHSLTIEIKILMLHGLLHLAGYDHESDTGEMARRERILRARLGLPLGLIERTAKMAHSSLPLPSPVSNGGARSRATRRRR
jgi:probable rRNA maturation factor